MLDAVPVLDDRPTAGPAPRGPPGLPSARDSAHAVPMSPGKAAALAHHPGTPISASRSTPERLPGDPRDLCYARNTFKSETSISWWEPFVTLRVTLPSAPNAL